MITRKDFEKGNFPKINLGKSTHPIIVFLKKNSARAYTLKEIAKAINMKENSCRSMLRKFKKKNIIEHKSPYSIIKK